jgi:hypothetical protein
MPGFNIMLYEYLTVSPGTSLTASLKTADPGVEFTEITRT